MSRVKFEVPSCENLSGTIYYLVKEKRENYRENIFTELPEELMHKIINNDLNSVKNEIAKAIKNAHKISELKKLKRELIKEWKPLNNLFFDNLKKITGYAFPFDSVIVYISEIIRGMYTTENLVFTNPPKKTSLYITAEEIFHLHYWYIFRKLIKNVRIPWRIKREYWEISEVVPEFVFTDDLFEPFGWGKNLHRNYPFIEKQKRKLLPLWKNKKNFRDFMIKIHKLK